MGDDRRIAELVASLAAVRGRLSDAADSVGRDPRSITLVAVTKTFPLDDVRALLELGVTDVGESRDQEAKAKAVALAQAGVPAVLHFVGRLQTNKCRSVATYADWVHSVDRPELVDALSRAAEQAESRLGVFVQYSVDGDPTRGGASEPDLFALADGVDAAPGLQLAGLMTVAPLGMEPDRAFAQAAEVAARLRAAHPHADGLSAGMSHDFDIAVKNGATHVRVGTALLGRREPPVG